MAPPSEYTVATALSAQVKTHDEGSILVEAGGIAAAGWFLDHAIRPNEESEATESEEPPSKKRKITKVKSAEVHEPPEHHCIPVSRVTIDLHFPETLGSKPVKEKAILEDVDFEDAESVSVVPSVIDLFDDGTRLKLALRRPKGAVMMVDTTGISEKALDALRKIAVSRIRPVEKDSNKASATPATWPRCTLSRSRGQLYTVLRVEATLYWQTGTSAFPSGVPTGKAKEYPDYDVLAKAFPDPDRDGIDHTQPWSPQDFYDSVHVASKAQDVDADFDEVLESQLYPFQKRAVHWMLRREQVTYHEGQVVDVPKSSRMQDSNYYQAFTDLAGSTCYVNHLQGIVRRNEPKLASSQLRGGILAEEMGLGKTVEVLALLSLHQRPEIPDAKVFDVDNVTPITPSRATLIITPPSIMQQWMSELAKHAPALKVMHYEGVSRTSDNEQLLAAMTTKYDVVVTTYNILARELHYAEDPPDRKMRQARKFERKRSPLVKIQWWRICLDEAQMVESGVTNAARVACRLPRINSWAVSGTPLRKDVQDLLGLLIFLRYRPFSEDGRLWPHMITYHRHLFRRLFGGIALRHTKVQIREDLELPPQKRVVITVPFTAVEQQHYSTMFTEMCEAVGVQGDGSPRNGNWDPSDPDTIQEMRSWLVRLRQTCLHPQVGGRNRRALGKGQGPLRTVAEVLEVMIDQNETSLRVEERALLSTQLTRAHILSNAKDDEHRAEKALEIYLAAMEKSEALVREARQKLAVAKAERAEKGEGAETDGDESSSSESTPTLGRLRNNVRTSLQLQHACIFFAATAYYQIKTNENLTMQDSEEFKALEEQETTMYERAKLLRKEILKDTSRKSEHLMRKIEDLVKNDNFTKMPRLRTLDNLGGIESRRIMEKSDDLFDVIREVSQVIKEWRSKMAEYLLKSLVDKDENEITGDEYEDSTKQQDELYAYFDAIKALHADLNTFVTAEQTPLIDHEMKTLIKAAKTKLNPDIADDMKTDVHAPELTLKLLNIRANFVEKKKDFGSVKGLIQEARSLETSLSVREGGLRAVEREIIHRHLDSLQRVLSEFTKASTGLEKEVELFRTTQNQRIEFYRQLQELSDAVAPYKKELDEQLDVKALEAVMQREEEQQAEVQKLTSKHTFLLNLRSTNDTQDEQRICKICTNTFELGVLTVCGHSYCKDCILQWWKEHKTCPDCRRKLSMNDFHNVTYSARELRAQEEIQSGASSPSDNETPSPSRNTSIYSDVDTQLMQEIKAIDLPTSYGTKIDTLGRHLHWIREHDPGAKSIVFSQYREFLTVLGTALKDFKIGFTRLGQAGAAEKFKSDPSIDCLLLDAKTDSSGLTLVNATHVFICEPLIQTAVELQAIARVHRIGQTRTTTVWMYLINDTVEESIYEISVARRLAHAQARQPNRLQKSRSATPAPLAENAIDAANSEELQAAPISKLLVNSKAGGEVVKADDLWQCLFGKARKVEAKPSVEMEMVVGRHLRAEAAEGRGADAEEDRMQVDAAMQGW